jgi:hypothetical protein
MKLRNAAAAAWGSLLGIVALVVVSGLCSEAFAQRPRSTTEEFETDRDSFTFAPTTAAPGTSILEASYSFVDNREAPEAHSFPEVLLRRGIGDRIEARFGYNYEAGGPGLASGSEFGGEDIATEDESRVLYGTKVETSDQHGWLPRSAAVIQGFTPVSGPSNKSTLMIGESFGWKFAGGWEWNTAVRYGTGFAADDSFSQWGPSSVVKIPVGRRWNMHAEYFGITSTGKRIPLNLQYASLGGHVMATDNLEIGLRLGWGLNATSPNFFSNFGIGWRR